MFFVDDFVGVNDSKESLQKLIDVVCVTLHGRIKGTARVLYCINPCCYSKLL